MIAIKSIENHLQRQNIFLYSKRSSTSSSSEEEDKEDDEYEVENGDCTI